MPALDPKRQGGTPFDPFLYAAVGEDRKGNPVTVLSTLARMGLEPWEAAAELADLTRTEARGRLDSLLARFWDVPALGQNHAAVTHRLVALLPSSSSQGNERAASLLPPRAAIGISPLLAILMLVLYVIPILLVGWNGSGN